MQPNLKIWPGYINPEKDELFSSWFIRLCLEHRIKSHSFSNFYFGGQTIWNRDIDKMFPDSIVDNILKHTCLCYDDVKKLFIEAFKDIVFNDESPAYTLGILNLGINHRKRKQNGLLCCPSCLSNDIVYFKKKWRLFFSLVCSDCKCLLIDSCPKCNEPIAFHRLENGNKKDILKMPLNVCWNCFYDLRKSIKKVPKNSLLLEYQRYIDDTIEKGYNDLTQYSFLYFSVLNLLATRLFTSTEKLNRVKRVVENYFNYSIKSERKSMFHNLEDRKIALIHSYLILKNWPYNFRQIFSNTNVRYSDFKRDVSVIPFWFEKELKNLH